MAPPQEIPVGVFRRFLLDVGEGSARSTMVDRM